MKKVIFKSSAVISGLMVFALTQSGCMHAYYAPNAHNVPLFQEKGEIRLSGTRAEGDEYIGGDVQAAYALTKNIGLMANGFFASHHSGFTRNGRSPWAAGEFAEAGIGYYKPFDKALVFETYAGFGMGGVRNYYDYADGFSNLKFTRSFIQPSLGFTTKFLDMALSTRFAALHYYKIDSASISPTYPQSESALKKDLGEIGNQRGSLLFEPAITVRAGWEYVKLQGQLGLSINMNNPNLNQENINLNIGAYITIAKKYERAR